MDDEKLNGIMKQTPQVKYGEHWRRFVQTGSIDDYLMFSKARSETAKASERGDDEGAVKN